MTLQEYAKRFESIRPNRSGGSVSPHKVCMMYAVMDLIEEGRISWNVIYYTPELKRRFTWHFERLRSPQDRLNSANPFFFLRSSEFWHHHLHGGQQTNYDELKTPSNSKIEALIEYVSLDKDLFELLQNPEAARVLRLSLASNLDSREEAFIRWARSIGKSEKTIKNYVGALKSSMSNWFQSAGISDTNILTISDYFDLQRIMLQANEVSEFVQRNESGNGMYQAALNLYQRYLAEVSQPTLLDDLDAIEQSPGLPETQRKMLAYARVGQGKFRSRLIEHWGSCAVTGYEKLPLLVASHIKPWKDSDNGERLDPYNGLLLVANLDRAFDLNYVTFDPNGRIKISDALGDYKKLGITQDMKVNFSVDHQNYMECHRSRFESQTS